MQNDELSLKWNEQILHLLPEDSVELRGPFGNWTYTANSTSGIGNYKRRVIKLMMSTLLNFLKLLSSERQQLQLDHAAINALQHCSYHADQIVCQNHKCSPD